MTDATMPPLGHPEPHTMKWTDLELSAIHDYARAYAAQCLAAVAEDAERYRWLLACKRVPWGAFLDEHIAAEEGVDAAIDNARGKK